MSRIVWLRKSWKDPMRVCLRQLIRSYRLLDPFPRNLTITIPVITHVTIFVIPSSYCFMIMTYHAIVAQARDISRHHHVLCTANAVILPMHSFSFMFHLFISAYEARRSSPCDFGLDQSDAVPTPRFSMKPFHLVTLGARGHLPSGYIVGTLWVLVKFAPKIPSGSMVGIF